MTATVQPLVGKQADSVRLATARVNVWEGSVRSSKTVCSLLRWLQFIIDGPGGNLAMIGKTERTLKRNVIDPLTEMLGTGRCRYVAGAGELWLLGRRVYVAGANNEAAVAKMQGLTLAGAYVDEAALMPESMWSMLLTRLSVDGAQLFATTNPDNPNHWLMRDYLSRATTWLDHAGHVHTSDKPNRLDLARFSFRIADNPSLSAAYVAALAVEFTGLWRLRFIEGLWVLAEGAIFDTFDPTPGAGTVLAEGAPLPHVTDWAICVDYGTTNPFVALLLGHGEDGCLYVASEYRHDSRVKHRQLTDADYSAELADWLRTLNLQRGEREVIRPDRVIVDPSAASFITQLWRDGWDSVHGANNAVADGIRWVSALLARDLLRIHPSCVGLIGELTGYVWDEKAAKRGVEQPLKVDDHGPDALRYGVMGTESWWRHWLTFEHDPDPADVS